MRQPAHQRRLVLRDLDLPDFRDYAVAVEQPGDEIGRGDPRTRALAARRHRARTRTNFRIFGPDETASNRLGAVLGSPTSSGTPRSSRPTSTCARERPRDGDAVRAPVPGLARGLSAHRAPRPLQLLRGVHPHRRLDVQPTREVAEGDAGRSRGADHSHRSTTSSHRTSGGRTTMASRTRTPASSTTS